MSESADLVQQCWERNNSTLAFEAVKTELEASPSMEDSIDKSIMRRKQSYQNELETPPSNSII